MKIEFGKEYLSLDSYLCVINEFYDGYYFGRLLTDLNEWIPFCWPKDYKFTIPAKTININGFEVPKPERNPLEVGQTYCIPEFIYKNSSYVWENDETDILFLRSGLLHLSRENAAIHLEALLSFTKLQNVI